MAGCSNGGRHAMVAAERYPDLYDGLLAGAPGFNLPKAAVQHAWDIQSWKLVDPDIRRAFSPADMKLVADQVVARCDPLDLLVDEDEMAKRRAAFEPLPPRYTRGVLAKYAKLVGSASRGAVCD